jgi:hypothetical protein
LLNSAYFSNAFAEFSVFSIIQHSLSCIQYHPALASAPERITVSYFQSSRKEQKTTSTIAGLVVLHIFRLGLQFAGHSFTKASYDKATRRDVRRFTSAYGLAPKAELSMFNDLHALKTGGARIRKPNIKHFFMTLHW